MSKKLLCCPICQSTAGDQTKVGVFIEKRRAKAADYYAKNKAKVIASVADYQKRNAEAVASKRRARYLADHERRLIKSAEYAAKRQAAGKDAAYRADNRSKARAYAKARAAEGGDRYAREQLSKDSPLSTKDWPQSIVDLKVAQIQLKRELRK